MWFSCLFVMIDFLFSAVAEPCPRCLWRANKLRTTYSESHVRFSGHAEMWALHSVPYRGLHEQGIYSPPRTGGAWISSFLYVLNVNELLCIVKNRLIRALTSEVSSFWRKLISEMHVQIHWIHLSSEII